jgi:GNAT superfamily N-acetyltransferase
MRTVNLTFERARPNELEELHAILTAAGLDMEARWGLSHWVPAYPLSLLQTAADAGRVYSVRRADSRIVGTFTLGRDAADYVPAEAWSADPAMYVTQLAVHPDYQGVGIGRSCMQWIEGNAKREGLRSVRLDASAAHEALLRFYRGQGYEERAQFWFRGTHLVCFEKILVAAS